MYDLFKSIIKKFDEEIDLNQALTGGLYNTEAPPNVSFPYGTFTLIAATPDHHASGKFYLENCLVQFSLFSKDLVEISNIQIILISVFDFGSLILDHFELISCVRENFVPLRIENVWQFNSDYRLYLYPDGAGA